MTMSHELEAMNAALIEQIKSDEQMAIAHSQQAMHEQGLKAQFECGCGEDSLELAGLNTKALADLEDKINEKDDREFVEADALLAEESADPELVSRLDVESGFAPEGAQIITPSWTDTFSDTLEHNVLAESTDVSAQPVLGGGTSKNVWNWAKGSGWGCTGGVGQNTQTVYWTFWFRPEASRFYSIKPRFQFNGYYIAKANDKWYNCKNSQVKISAHTQAYQYNWKHKDGVNLVNINKGNVNVNKRLDDSRFTSYSALLGKNDWAAIVCSVRLYVRAQGGGSYAKNDFSTGANRVAVPYVIVN
ncbi:hypothetical protein DXX93_11915 [Thalassotalea euphylliae]|uniref:Uncharacterized protein n=1 Tax=Thalassotalea euphylliae TaxID=1655234 RepID=A0A3E0TRU2_9GAMM|nr:hypothetical protein [Thalassotalea euphylliae]REL27203.1 hypothetical protein DXX93_11915 [Thalassotalea euphylliae]